jgi:hypothetical protein
MTETLDRKIDRLNTKLTTLLSERKEEKLTWVKSTIITRLTGWNSEDMRRARNYEYVKFKKDRNGFWYALESLNPALYEKSATDK